MTRVRLFGKLPAHGDFVSRGLDTAERDEVDAWLSASLDDARERCGEAFEPLYDVAPAWRFAGAGRAEALAPSMDRAGRRFPVWLAVDDGAAAACEDLLYRALAEGWDADALAAQAEVAVMDSTGASPGGWWIEDAAGAVVARLPGHRPAGLLHAMLTVREKVDG